MPMGKLHLPEKDVATIFSWIRGDDSAEATVAHRVDNSPVTQHDAIPILSNAPHRRPRTVAAGKRVGPALESLHAQEGKPGPAIVSGKPEECPPIKRINAGEMAPKRKLNAVGAKPITPAASEKVARSIRQGEPKVELAAPVAGTPQDPLVTGKDHRFWSFQTPIRPEAPQVKHRGTLV